MTLFKLELAAIALLFAGCTNHQCDEILKASSSGDVVAIQKLLRSNPRLASCRAISNGETPLNEAAYAGHKTIAEILIDNGAQVNEKGFLEATPLHCATLKGHKDVVELLLAHGADVNAIDGWALTALQRAAEKGQSDIALLLINKGADLNMAGGRGWDIEKHRENLNGESIGWTPLHWAVGNHNKEIVELLLAKGADFKTKDKSNRTPLQLAVERKDEQIANLLRQSGATE